MKRLFEFVKTTAIGGLLFLIPLIILIIVLGKAFNLMGALAAPIAKLIPLTSIGGLAIAEMISVVFIISICFLFGLAAKTKIAHSFRNAVESKILLKIPIYSFIKHITDNISGIKNKENLRSVLVEFDDNAQIGFEIERTNDDRAIIYLPGTPNPWSGTVVIVQAERVKSLDINFNKIIKTFSSFGYGINNLLSNK
jgi:uncharacterized membrane protein